MACDKHTKDGTWTHDLIWHYLHATTTSTGGGIAAHYKGLDPAGDLKDRHRVYELLVDEPNHTFPANALTVATSMIPWNQNNAKVLEQVKGKLVCGDIVKYFFARYMGGGTNEPPKANQRSMGNPTYAAKWVVQKLQSNKPVRALLSANHYVGIVGYRCAPHPKTKACASDFEFLYIDPWAGGTRAKNSIVYAGTRTKFLGIMRLVGKKLEYPTNDPGYDYHVTDVEAW